MPNPKFLTDSSHSPATNHIKNQPALQSLNMAGAGKKRVQQARSERSNQTSSEQNTASSSRQASSSGKPTRSATSSNSRGGSASPPGNVDGNEDPAPSPTTAAMPEVNNRNIDLPVSAYAVMRTGEAGTVVPRPKKPSTLGVPLKMGLNTFNVTNYPTKPVHQYEIMIGNGVEKRGLIMKVWESKELKKQLGDAKFIFDGNRLGWSTTKLSREIKTMVNLDEEQGRTPRPGKTSDVTRVMIRHTNEVRFDVLDGYLKGTVLNFDKNILAAVNFLDHLLREYPSQRYTAIKRNFFSPGEKRFPLGGGVEAFKGVYQSMRIVHGGANARLSVNIDVANGTFWTANKLTLAAVALCGARDVPDLVNGLRDGERSRYGQTLKKIRKLHVISNHRGQTDKFVIDRIVYQSARDYKFEKDGKQVSIYDYYAKTYNHRLQFPDLPLVKATRGKNTMIPMEVLALEENTRYNFKLNEGQTTNMIRFAVTPPPERWGAIEHGLNMLNWDSDPILKHFGLQIDRKKTMVDGRLIPAPTVKYGAGEAKPGTSGRWDLKGKKFLSSNPVPLKSWAVCVIGGRRSGKPDKSVVQGFISQFVTVYKNHGGRVENAQPAMSLAKGDDIATWVTDTWNAAGNQASARPQMLVFILPDKDSQTYGRIKRSCECRYGVVSQCMQYAHVLKGQGQYISNVCMKFNAKLGGNTCRSIGPKTGGPTGAFSQPTMMIGADVSHAAPGGQTPSMAALTVSADKLGARYTAVCQTNGFRVEMITTETINTDLKPLVQNWIQNVGDGKMPKRVLYFRDGVSEGQYAQVLNQEVTDMKNLLKGAAPNAKVDWVVVVGSKRHHVRFFPEKGDSNGNPLPGTLVETGVTHPYENDFYLNSHKALKGTSRPMHYHILLNEAGMSNEELQTLIYEQCYQYMRSTTPVSQHPAMYYAHIAADRAGPHDPKWAGSSDTTPQQPKAPATKPRSNSQTGSGGPAGSAAPRSAPQQNSSSAMPIDAENLLPMPNQGGINTSMWFI